MVQVSHVLHAECLGHNFGQHMPETFLPLTLRLSLNCINKPVGVIHEFYIGLDSHFIGGIVPLGPLPSNLIFFMAAL